MSLATRPIVRMPYSYKGFYLTRSHGRLYGIPPFLDPDELHLRKRLHIHPAVLSASTIEELKALVDCLLKFLEFPEFGFHQRPSASFRQSHVLVGCFYS